MAAYALTVGKPDLAQSPGLRLGHVGGFMDAGNHGAELSRLEHQPAG